MNLNTQTNLQVAKNLYYNWLQEQEDDFLLVYKAESYLKKSLWFEMRYFLEENDEQIGKFVKAYMEFAVEEIDKLKQNDD